MLINKSWQQIKKGLLLRPFYKNMAGIQSCFRSKVLTGLRLINKNEIYWQSVRERHKMFQMSLPINIKYIKNSKVLFISNSHSNLYRLASTNVTVKKPVQTVSESSESQVAGSSTTEAVSTVGDVGNAANSNVLIDEASLPPIPVVENEVPPIFEFVSTGLKEPSFESLGLASYWPPGLIQRLLEFLHISCDLPWWGAIVIVTCLFRTLVFPLYIKGRKNAINFSNCLPKIQEYQMALTEARHTGNYYEAAFQIQEFEKFMKTNSIATFGSFWPSLAQAPIFISMFLALKGMVKVPVESLKTGGLFWFQDLTLSDPYCGLPLCTALSLVFVLEISLHNVVVSPNYQIFVKYGARVAPFILLPITMNFESAILLYWAISNFITLGQTALFKLPSVQRYFNFPVAVVHDLSKKPTKEKKKQGLITNLREGINNVRLTMELENRERLNAVTFEKAGKGPVKRTFKKNIAAVEKKS